MKVNGLPREVNVSGSLRDDWGRVSSLHGVHRGSYIPLVMTPDVTPPDADGGTITVRCRLFGRYAELAGTDEVDLTVGMPATAQAAVAKLTAALAAAAAIPPHPLVAINRQHARLDAILAEGDELALLPPLAGG